MQTYPEIGVKYGGSAGRTVPGRELHVGKPGSDERCVVDSGPRHPGGA